MAWLFVLWVSSGLCLATISASRMRRCWLLSPRAAEAPMSDAMKLIWLESARCQLLGVDDQHAVRLRSDCHLARLAYLSLVAWMASGYAMFWGRFWQ